MPSRAPLRRTGPLPASRAQRPARLGFAGLGWIGRHRLRAVVESGEAAVVALADPCREALEQAAAEVASEVPGENPGENPGEASSAALCRELDELLQHDLDGVVLATPSAQHAAQAIRALERGMAVFCQKPLARTAQETAEVIQAARRADRLLAIDLSYRRVEGMDAMRHLVRSGQIGKVFAADLVFHNAYGPDKPWFYDPSLSGGGCLMDLGTHLVDLAQWILGPHRPGRLDSYLASQGERLAPNGHVVEESVVEDYAAVHWETPSGAQVRVTCSWRLSAGCDAVIRAALYGSRGAVVMENVNGSFYDLVVTRMEGTRRRVLAGPDQGWGGRALLDWVRQLARGGTYDPEVESLLHVAEILDRCYGRSHAEDPR